MKKTLGELAEYLGAVLKGDPAIEIVGVASINEAKPGDITFMADRRHREHISTTHASAMIVAEGEKVPAVPHLVVPHPYLAFAKVLELFFPKPTSHPEADPRAHIGENVQIGEGVSIGPWAYIGNGTQIGEQAVIAPGVWIGAGCWIGDHTVLQANVSLYPGSVIGNRVTVHCGTVVGSDGFGYTQTEDGYHYKIPQVGRVVIEDDVEIGANVCIDRATVGSTVVKKGTKIDNLVHIGHNNVIGEHCLLLAQVGMSGSCRVGDRVAIAGQVGVIDHVSIGDRAVIVAQSGITKDIPAGEIHSGSPAVPHMVWKKMQQSLPKLPDLIKEFRQLEKRLQALEQKLINHRKQ